MPKQFTDVPAFPTRVVEPFGEGRMDIGGVTMRDYFAAKVMASIAASPEYSSETWEKCAAIAYKAADAMLAAREE